MKRCPNCNTLFEDSLLYCNNDGATLIEENFVLPSEIEEETVIHHEPINVDVPSVSIQPEATLPRRKRIIPVIFKRTEENTGKYFFFLALGLLLGGVLAIAVLALILLQPRNPTTENTTEKVQISNGKHEERNKTRKDSEFNGFVLSENANIRSAPNSSVFEALPQNDRLNILERDGTWYRVICEHGSGGWMHGNTIRFNDDAAEF